MTGEKIRIFTVPNLFTLANLACGAAAAVFALRSDDLRTAFWLVVAAAVLDFVDGFVARLTRQYSEVGRELDSLCDMVSFGLVPGAVLFSMYGTVGGPEPWGWSVFAITLFAALRLAKFNVDRTQAESFVGLPTPASALLVASGGWLFASGGFTVAAECIVAASVLLAYMSVCPLRMFALKFSDFSLRNNAVRYCFLALAAGGLIVFGIAAIPFIIIGYVIVSAVGAMVCK